MTTSLGVHFEERHGVQRLLPHTDEIAAHTAVNDPLLGDDGQVAVHLQVSELCGAGVKIFLRGGAAETGPLWLLPEKGLRQIFQINLTNSTDLQRYKEQDANAWAI